MLFSTILTLLVILAGYQLAGWWLRSMATGGQSLESVLRDGSPQLLRRVLLTQGIGQILVLGLPVLFLTSRYSGALPFERTNLQWLGIGTGGGVRPALFGAGGMLLLQPLLYSIVELQIRLLPLLGQVGRALVEQQEWLKHFIRALTGELSPGHLLASSLVFVLIPSICEELLFRGYIQKSLVLNIKPHQAVLFTGLVFAFFHLELFNLLPLTLLGWYIGYLHLKTGNLLVPAAAHATNNLSALGLLYLTDGQNHAGQEAVLSPAVLCVWLALVVASLVIFLRVMRYFSEKPMPGGR